jgi:hypothetical protein
MPTGKGDATNKMKKEKMTPAEDESLDKLLAAWREQNALPEARVEAMRRAILESPQFPSTVELNAAWWQGMFKPLAKSLRVSADIRRFLPVSSHLSSS